MRKGVTLVVGAAATAGVAVSVGVARARETAEPPPACPINHALRVTAAPEITRVVSAVFQAAPAAGPSAACPKPTVLPGDSATTAGLLAGRGDAADPDVWIPDSSLWVSTLTSKGRPVAGPDPSVARTPVVAAVKAASPQVAAAAAAPGWSALLPAPGAVQVPIRWGLPGMSGSVASTAAALGIRATLAGRATEKADLTTVLRSASLSGAPDTETRLSLAATKDMAAPATEQEVYAYNRSGAQPALTAVYPDGAAAATADYPFVVLTTDPARQQQAQLLLQALQSDTAKAAVRAAGFRDGSGAAGAELTGQRDVDAAKPASAGAPDAAGAASVTAAAARLVQGSQVLTVLDISGSMAAKVPGADGATRLDLALRAAMTGLGTYPDNTKAGLWVFSTKLTPTTDYQELVPLVPLGQGPDGTSGRARLSQGMAAVKVKKDGGTGLYDTVLAAVRAVRDNWDPNLTNSVVVITDGANDDDSGGVDLPTLLHTLQAEQDPARPVAVFPIAYGASSDPEPLKQIVAVTGGAVYESRDPRDIGSVIQDAIGRRVS